MKFDNAPHVIVSPMALEGVRANFHRVLTGLEFVPVCQYPVGFSVETCEQGMLAKVTKDGEIVDVYKRVFSK